MKLVIHNHFPGTVGYRTRDEAWAEGKHPRGQPGNAGQFAAAPGGGGSKGKEKAPGGLSPYFAKKFGPSTSKEHLIKQAMAAVKLKNGTSYYRTLLKMLLEDADKFGAHSSVKDELKHKLVESLAIQKDNLLKLGKVQQAATIEKKLVGWGAPTTPAALPIDVTSQDLEKAKNTGSMPLYGVPPAAVPLVEQFNNSYAGKALTEQNDLVQKVKSFKTVQKFVAEAKAAEEKKNAEGAKQVMKELGISEEQSQGFLGLADMLGVTSANLTEKFKQYEEEAKSYGYPMSGFECALIKSYSNGSYSDVNEALRSGAWDDQQHVYAKMLNSALSKMPPHTGTVWRGATLGERTQSMYKVGRIVEERAFTSTTTKSGHSQADKGNTRYVIKAKGHRGAEIKKLSHHGGEHEVLFQARTFFKVTEVKGSPGGPMTIHMEEWD